MFNCKMCYVTLWDLQDFKNNKIPSKDVPENNEEKEEKFKEI